MTELEQFKQHGDSASYHCADDSCREWDLANNEMNQALMVFDANPELQPQMREIAKGFLWSLGTWRPQQ